MSINPSEEKYIKEAEEDINKLWGMLKERFNVGPDKLMAMVAFQFAKLYTLQKAREKQAIKALEEFEKELLDLTAAIDGVAKGEPKGDPHAPGPADHPSLL